jgi:purine nucleosidase
MTPPAPTPVLLDTDLGSDVDDALALALLLAAPERLSLVAVTTVAGDTRARAWAAARLLGLAGRDDVEVCAGEAAPLLRHARFVWRDIETAGWPEGPDAVRSEEPAPERIVRAAREVPGLELVAIGPLTNLARALALDPKLPRRVAGLTVMGGHVRRAAIGSLVCDPGIDYNLCSDPEASVAVLGAGFATRLVTADVTLQTWMSEADLRRLESAGGPVARALVPLVRLWTPWMHRLFTGLGGTLAPDNVAFLHDPLAVLALIDPAPLRFERLRVVPTIERGVMRTREADPAGDLGAPMEVATAVDAPAAARAIAERIARI